MKNKTFLHVAYICFSLIIMSLLICFKIVHQFYPQILMNLFEFFEIGSFKCAQAGMCVYVLYPDCCAYILRAEQNF